MLWQGALLYLVVINILTWLLFAIDKRRSRRRQWRISERTLLFLSLFGGTPGAYLGRRMLHHKTRKQPFSTLLHGILILQVIALVGIIWLALSAGKYI